MAEKTDSLIRFLLPDAQSRGVIIRGSNIIAAANRIHGLHGSIAQLFDQTLLASILLLSVSKGGTRQVLQLNAKTKHNADTSAPVKKILSEARQGSVRGYMDWADEHIMLHHQHSSNITDWLGKPMHLSTLRDLGFGQPYLSTIEHDSDYLTDHLMHYLQQSVQIKADIILHADLAIMIEAMPGCDDQHWFKAVEAMARIPNRILDHDTPESILHYFDDLHIKQAGIDAYAYHCGCSAESMQQAIQNLPTEQIASLADEHGNITASCQYCNTHHIIAFKAE